KAWIDAGAKWGKHWAYETPKPVTVPKVKQADWPRDGIDAFILARLEQEGLKPSKAADRITWLRRLTLDLTGLPPTLAEVDAFQKDKSPEAFEKVVDRLLASPRYGERMAWDWLEAARYADSNGYQGDRERTMWPWRDWVIRAFNANQPYDDFTVEQIAGDLLPNATEEQILATGFNRNHMINGEGGRIAAENRVEYVFDQTETVGTVWMGLTLTCCRCHDHKFDPLSQKDYYSLYSFFNQTPVNGGGGDPAMAPNMQVGTSVQKQEIAALEQKIAGHGKAIEKRRAKLQEGQAAWEVKRLKQDSVSAWEILRPVAARAKNQTLDLQEDRSVLAKGKLPDQDEYSLQTAIPTSSFRHVRLEALQHTSLPSGGLSRVKGGNFVLTDIQLILEEPDREPREVKLTGARATFNQGGLDVKQAIDNNVGSGWGVWPGPKGVKRPHTAIFTLGEPLKLRPDARLIFQLKFNHSAKQHVMGRFRISVSDSENPGFGTSDLTKALKTKPDQRSKEMKELIAREYSQNDSELKKLQTETESAQKRINDLRKSFPKVMVMRDGTKRETRVLTRGIYNKPTDIVVSSNTPASLPKLPKSAPRNRLGLAVWLVDEQHPLTARVTVNRIWQQFFGTGFVKTTEDFGVQSERPSHPGLLDWLALEFVKSGWDLKALHRRIVLSSTYRQSSVVTPALRERDPNNRLLARMSRYRLPSWMIRDQALYVGGLLVEKQGGPSVKPYQPDGVWAESTFGKKRYSRDKGEALYRRSLYTFWRRIVGPTMFFDEAKRQTCEVRRARTNTPLHALITLNDIAYVEAARAMAQRVLNEGGVIDTGRIAYAFRLATTRSPSDDEVTVLKNRLNQLRRNYSDNNEAAQALLKVGEHVRNDKFPVAEHAAYTVLCNLILNLDEVITRE
ncbi:MAG: DUF1549 and DUF1553 domain-containing protein, partial [Verrucomicrobiota bacterium]|nr:DUF1549 and DUF1553 domain-containing protein [Verrucomicrobiota bacterium]